MEFPFVTPANIRKVSSNGIVETEDHLATEEPLEIQLEFGSPGKRLQKNISVTMRTPGYDEGLAAGFLFTEGIISNSDEILSITVNGINRVLVSLSEGTRINLARTERNFYTTSSCGVCGKTSIDAIKTVSLYDQQATRISVQPELLHSMYDQLMGRQQVFEQTGGMHAAALYDLNGCFLTLREDVGRHNALDKLIGYCFLNNQLPLSEKILLLSGRASFELLQKASMAGIQLVAAVGAPSSLAVELAKACGITLLGFLRNERFNIYSGAERIRC
jgi:FdhD protein